MGEGNGSLAALVDRAAENAWFKFGGRLSMVLATLVGLPVAGWLGARALDRIEANQIAIATLQANIIALRSYADVKDAEQDRRLDGHDRALERLTSAQRLPFPH